MNEELRRLREENEELKALVGEFQSLKEDKLARAVFEKARRLLFSYMTIGAIAVALVGFFGVRSLLDYTWGAVQGEVDQIAKDSVERQCEVAVRDLVAKKEALVEELAAVQVHALITDNREEIMLIAAEVVRGAATGGLPIGVAQWQPVAMDIGVSADWPDSKTPVRDLGNEGSCVGFAVAAALEYSINQNRAEPLVLSPRYIYYVAREAGGYSLSSDTGVRIQDAVQAIAEHGVITEDAWPYVAGEYAESPPSSVAEVRRYWLEEHEQVDGPEELIELLDHGPVVAGFAIYLDSLNASSQAEGLISMPQAGDQLGGALAVCFVGYDEDTRLFRFKNCWGSGWGDDGYGFVSYDYLAIYMSDAWYLHLGTGNS